MEARYSEIMITAVLFILITATLAYYYFLRRNSNYPPGPFPLPIIGNLHQIATNPHIVFQQMSKKYGPIVAFKFGPDNAIAVHGTELIKEAFSNPAFHGKRKSEAKSFVFGDANGIISASGEVWTEQRRFALRHLRDFGFGKSSMEEMIMEEVNQFSNWLKKESGNPVSLQHRFSLATLNSIWRILAGERFDHDDPLLHKILDDLKKSAKSIRGITSLKSFLIFFYPAIAKMFPDWSGWSTFAAHKIPRAAIFSQIIQEHKETCQEHFARDFVDLYLQKIRQTTSPASSFYMETGEDSLKSVMADLFLAGTDTMAVTLSWLYIYLLHYPRVQKKVHEELDRVIGRNRPATLSDRKWCVYTEAVILETFRLSSIVGALNHTATEDVRFHGYDIPKGTMVFINLHANHHDPEIWGNDVEEYRPERFLSPDEATLLDHEGLMPFSTGRRKCLAESFARETLFLFAANLGLNFEVALPEGQHAPSLNSEIGQLTLSPSSNNLIMKER